MRVQCLYAVESVRAINSEHENDFQHVWHRCFGHRNPGTIKDLESKGLAIGIKVKDCKQRQICESAVRKEKYPVNLFRKKVEK